MLAGGGEPPALLGAPEVTSSAIVIGWTGTLRGWRYGRARSCRGAHVSVEGVGDGAGGPYHGVDASSGQRIADSCRYGVQYVIKVIKLD